LAIPKAIELKFSKIYNLRAMAAFVDAIIIALIDCAIMYFAWLVGMAQGILDASLQHWEQILYSSAIFLLDGLFNIVLPASGIYLNNNEAFPLKTTNLANWFMTACVVANWLYYTIFESSEYKATPGQSLVGLIVVDQYDRKISFATATIRHLAKMLGGLFCGIGLLPIWTSKRVPLQDWLSKSTIKSDN
jgi:RDD family.